MAPIPAARARPSRLVPVLILLLAGAAMGEPSRDPQTLMAESGMLDDIKDQAVVPSQQITVFNASEDTATFNLHSYLTYHDGKFWASWSSGFGIEESEGQVVRYASSPDGVNWSEPKVLVQAHDVPGSEKSGTGINVNRGIFVHNGKLTNYVAKMDGNVRGEAWENLRLRRYTWDEAADTWQDAGLVRDDTMSNYPPRPLGEALFMTRRDGNREVHTMRSAGVNDDTTWTSTPLPDGAGEPNEPTWYVGPDGVAHMIMRDNSKGNLLHSISEDQGRTWSAPVSTDYPDAISKNFTGKLPDGTIYLINNPGPGRHELAISFSQDGWTFSEPKLLLKNPPAPRFHTASHQGYQYPHAMVRDGSLWLISALNKEDVQIHRYELEALGQEVPEPGSAALLLGAGGLAMLPRRLRR